MAVLKSQGVRDNNPLDLEYNETDKWQGLAANPKDGKLFAFKDPIYGLRAGARTLIAYQDKNGCKTVTDFITRFAPPTENPTASYISFVASYMKVTPTAPIDVHQYDYIMPMIKAMVQQESGAPYSDYYTQDILDKALVLAGVEPVKKSLVTAPQIVAGTVAAAAVVAPTLLDQLHQMHDVLLPYASSNPTINAICTAIALFAVGCSMYGKYSERQKGIS